jgi:polysaccharide biosynthesis protein PslH
MFRYITAGPLKFLKEKKLLKILQICNKAPYPANDGSSIAIYYMARGLVANGAELTLLAINTKKHFKPDDKVPENFRQKTRYVSVFCNTSLSPAGALLNLFSRNSYFVSRFDKRAFRDKLIETLGRQEFDIIQLEGLFMAVYLDTIRKHSKARIILRAHNIEHHIWKRHIRNENSFLKRTYLRLQNKRLRIFELESLSKVDAVVPISSTDEAEMRKMGCTARLFSCITGVDVQDYRQKPGLPDKNNSVFYFGSMDWLPNQEAVAWFLENCWDKVIRTVPYAKLIIAGRGMPLHFFHITRPNVSIVENVENGRNFYHQHQVMIVPLWSGSGLRIKIIEGMAYGKAIVSTSVGAEGIGCTDGKNILIADDAQLFAQHVITLLQDSERRKSLETNAADYAGTEFDNNKVVSRLVSFYKELLNA